MEEKSAIQEIIDEIMDSDLKVSEKLHLINAFSPKDRKAVNKARQEVVEGYKYCPVCKEWYLEKAWDRGFDWLPVHYCPVGHIV